MLNDGRITMNEAEHAAVDKLASKNADAAVSMTRRDPGEAGPLLVHVDNSTYIVDDAGKATKQKDS
jgi:hypothetical protein